MSNTRARAGMPAWLPSALPWAGAVALAIGAGWCAESPDAGLLPPGARAFPRVSAPPPNLGVLLWQLGVGSVTWYAVVLALPVLLWAARRVDTERLGRTRTALLSLAVVAGAATITAVVQYLVAYDGAPVRPDALAYLPVVLRQGVLPWIALGGVVAGVEWRRRAARASIERERLRAQLAEQRLLTLTGQLQPHFLFNTLQGISTLIHRDPVAADDMLAKLSDLLSELLRHRDQAVVALEDEVRYARTYLEIAKIRFADRLAFSIESPPGLARATVPLFLLQPLVENALAHGIGAVARGGTIRVRAERHGERVRLTVADDGAGLPVGRVPRDGVGLANTRERLRATFGDDQQFRLEAGPEGGVTAVVEMPFRPFATQAPAAAHTDGTVPA
ncbi:MAG: histidine kinase [Gemmatimonadetes bacterium]|nr:histidine kinase [Gemmatimonadota bacterium]